MQGSGAILCSVEMALFELMRDAKHEQFKAIQRVDKVSREVRTRVPPHPEECLPKRDLGSTTVEPGGNTFLNASPPTTMMDDPDSDC